MSSRGTVLQWGFMISSTFNLTLLTLERYFALVHPMVHRRAFTASKVKVAMIVVWFIGPLLIVPISVLTTRAMETYCLYHGIWPSEKMQLFFGFLVIVLSYFVPLAIIVYCYVCIVITLMRTVVHEASEQNSSDIMRNKKMARAWKNIVHTLLMVSCFYVVCWSPNQFYFFFSNLGYHMNRFDWLYLFTSIWHSQIVVLILSYTQQSSEIFRWR